MSFADFEGNGTGRRQQNWGGGSYQNGGGGFGGSNYGASATGNEYERMIDAVYNNIKQINFNVSQITKMVQSMGISNKDSHELRLRLRETIENTRKVALDTNKALKDMASIHGGDIQERKKRETKLKNDFQSCLERFQEISRVASKKAASTAPPPQQQQQHTMPTGGFSTTPYYDDDGEDDEQQSLIAAQKRQQMMDLEGDREFQSALIDEREQGIRQIESTIQEVNDIFIDLATLVQEQSPMIDNIESHIDSAVASSSKGVVELRKAASYQKAARTKMCCLILIIVAVVGVVVLALALGISFGLK